MPRAKTKTELISASETQFKKLMDMIVSLDEGMKHGTFQFEDRDRCLKDIVVHLYEWHQMMIPWILENTSGIERSFLPVGYNWRTYPQLNVKFWEKHQNTKLEDAIELFTESHETALNLIKGFSDEELFTKKYFNWTGNSSLGSYCVSNLPSHYDWAMKKLKRHIKTYNQE